MHTTDSNVYVNRLQLHTTDSDTNVGRLQLHTTDSDTNVGRLQLHTTNIKSKTRLLHRNCECHLRLPDLPHAFQGNRKPLH